MEDVIIEYKEIPVKEEILKISETFNLNKYISALAIQRIGYDIEKINNFLNSNIKNLHDPFLFTNINECIELLSKHIKNNNKILIYGDYDVDGITGTALLYNFLKDNFKTLNNLFYKTASRFSEGYGLSNETVNQAINDNISLIITIDCGTKDYESINNARLHNIDVIVLDHHELGDEKNNCNFIINPKCNDYNYPFKYLSGCAVVFKFISALNSYCNLNSDYLKYLDIVALSICCDVVPLTDENRILLVKGLEIINSSPCTGIKAIIDTLKLNHISINDILFKIGPMLNAPGRIKDAKICVDLLVSNNIEKIKTYIQEINDIYSLRKTLCDTATKNINETLKKSINTSVLYNSDWNIGILGILAAKCVEKTHMPAIIMSNRDDNYIVGSARSIDGINILKLIEECSCFLYKFGGHEMAAGFILEKKNLDNFYKKITSLIEINLKTQACKKKIQVDMKIPIKNISKQFFEDLLILSPFGESNKKPIFEGMATFINSSFFYNNTIFKLKDTSGSIFTAILRNQNIIVNGTHKIFFTVEGINPLEIELIIFI